MANTNLFRNQSKLHHNSMLCELKFTIALYGQEPLR